MNTMKCECGSTERLAKHLPMENGWITLTNPICEKCRVKKQAEFADAHKEFHRKIAERKQSSP